MKEFEESVAIDNAIQKLKTERIPSYERYTETDINMMCLALMTSGKSLQTVVNLIAVANHICASVQSEKNTIATRNNFENKENFVKSLQVGSRVCISLGPGKFRKSKYNATITKMGTYVYVKLDTPYVHWRHNRKNFRMEKLSKDIVRVHGADMINEFSPVAK